MRDGPARRSLCGTVRRRVGLLLNALYDDVHIALARRMSEGLDRLVLRGAPPGLGLLHAGELDDPTRVWLQLSLQQVSGAATSQNPPAVLLGGGRDGARVLLEFGWVEHFVVRDHVRCHCETSFAAGSIATA